MLITLSGFQLWYYHKALLSYPLKILGAFKTSPSLGVKAITSLIPINLHLQKLSGRSQLHLYSLPLNHILCSLLEARPNLLSTQHALSLNSLTRCQYEHIRGYLVNMDNQYNKVFPFFDLLNPEFFSSHKIIDMFNSCFSFHLFSKCSDQNPKLYIQQLDNLALESSSIPSNVLIIMDASIKNNITTSISHIHIHNKPVIKTLHHTVNITSTKAELFTIKCSINQATIHNNISKIIVITDSIHTVRKIFDLTSHPFQKYSAAILTEL